MSDKPMEELIKRVKAATEGSARLDLAICNALFPERETVPYYTTSIDAAVTLYKVLPSRIPSNPLEVVVEALRAQQASKAGE